MRPRRESFIFASASSSESTAITGDDRAEGLLAEELHRLVAVGRGASPRRSARARRRSPRLPPATTRAAARARVAPRAPRAPRRGAAARSGRASSRRCRRVAHDVRAHERLGHLEEAAVDATCARRRARRRSSSAPRCTSRRRRRSRRSSRGRSRARRTPGRCRRARGTGAGSASAAASTMRWPPKIEPVKTTWSTRSSPTMRSLARGRSGAPGRGAAGRPPSANARAKCSPQSGVRGLCLTTTALPASTAGTTQLTAVSSG